jgi:hypothetical protein
MRAGTWATIKHVATHERVPGEAPVRVVSSAPRPNTAAREDYPAANKAALMGRYSQRDAPRSGRAGIRVPSTRLPINEHRANARGSRLPAFPRSVAVDNQRARCVGLPSGLAGSGERSPP